MSDVAIPRPAATLLLLRDGPSGLETLMVVRHEKLAFGSGALVFPGGRVDGEDREYAAEIGSGQDGEGLAHRIAAIRETFEESGVLLAVRRDGTALDGETARALTRRHRPAVCAGQFGFVAMLKGEDLLPSSDALVPFAHWITPPTRPKRFDTHFYVAEAPAGQEAVHDGTESTESVWLSPGAAFAGVEATRYKLLLATRMNLQKLAASADVASALATAREARVVTVTPETISDDGVVRTVRIPEEAGYGGEVFRSTDPPAI